jgi:hypothetical protein
MDDRNAARRPQFRQAQTMQRNELPGRGVLGRVQSSPMRGIVKANSWFSAFGDVIKLGIESQAVIAARCAIVAKGGPSACLELQRMFWEKVAAYGEASVMLFWGAHPKRVVRRYRRHVRSNKRRLIARRR